MSDKGFRKDFPPDLGMSPLSIKGWFERVPEEMKLDLTAISTPRMFEDGQFLFHKGGVSEGLFYILSGEVRSSSTLADGSEVVINLFEAGTCVGLSSALDGQPSPTTCSAYGQVLTWLVPSKDLQALLDFKPVYYRYFNALLLEWFRGTLTLMEDQALLSVRARVAKRLLQFAYIQGEECASGIRIPIKIPQEELALWLGTTRQSIHGQISDFKKSGWLGVENGYLVVLDVKGLCSCLD